MPLDVVLDIINQMEKNNIEYQDPLKQSFSDLSQISGSFAKVIEIDAPSNLTSKINKSKSTKTKDSYLKISSPPKTHPLVSFYTSTNLLNLLRQPVIQNQSFSLQYLQSLKIQIQKVCKISTIDKQSLKLIIVYFHLILSKIVNLQDLQPFSNQKVKELNKNTEETNILNAHCILKCLEKIEGKANESQEKSNLLIEIVNEDCIFGIQNEKIIMSHSYVEKAINARGYLDVHFSAFLVHQLPFTALLSYFTHCEDFVQLQNEYADHYHTLFEEDIKPKNYQQWYQQQVQDIVNGEFSFEEVRRQVLEGERNQFIEKLLIGLHGWSDKYADEAVILLNCYYDGTDWQKNSAFSPSIAQVKDLFQIDYLIEDTAEHRHCLLLCLKAPCMDKNYNEDVFSWHHIKIKEYTSEGQTYLWVQLNLQSFRKCGFYDWKLFQIGSDGVNHEVKKIVNITQHKKVKAKTSSLKTVQGRIIVHPSETKQLQIHEIYMDSLSSNEKLNRIPHFADAVEDIKRYAGYGINCAYLMGVFERDNGKFSQGYKRPNASPMALTCRKTPCKMLGGAYSFKNLVDESQKVGVKIITDCTTRVSSSRMKKVYEEHLVHYLDETGKKYPLYGSVGRSINYEETTVLNYRKLQAWDLLIDEVSELATKFGINGIYLDQGFSWPQIYEIDKEEMLREEEGKKIYDDDEIFEGNIVIRDKQAGYWATKARYNYANPFLIKVCKKLWEKHGNFLIISDGFHMQDEDEKLINVIESGPIPRLFKMTKAIAQIMGLHLQENGTINNIKPKNISSLKRWYEQIQVFLPKNSIIIQSTTSHIWPYPAYLFKKATWAVIDLFFFLPEIPMTFIGEHDGKAYRTKTTSIFLYNGKTDKKDGKLTKLKKTNSSFFDSGSMNSGPSSSVVSGVNSTVCDPTQIDYLESVFRKEVGPEFGFDLTEIHKHYDHRRKLRSQIKLLTSGKMMSVTAEHMYGLHKNVLSFAKWNSSEIILISINFNPTAIDMHYNLHNFKYIFTKANRSTLVVKIKEIFGQNDLEEDYYTISQLLSSKIQAHIKAYKSIIWRITIEGDEKLEDAFECSRKRLASRINAHPPKWIYSSIFTNQLNCMVKNTKNLKSFIHGLNLLYTTFIEPDNLSLNLAISKTHEFWVNKVKLSKLFGILKLIQKHPDLSEMLQKHIQQLIEGNSLGPIAFVTPEIGSWSSVGGLGVMVDELSKELVKLGEQVYIVTPYYEYNKKKQTNYLERDGFHYDRNVKTYSSNLQYEFGVHRGKKNGVNFIWLHNPQLFSRPYAGEGALYVTKQLVFFALSSLQGFCQLKIFPSIIITNDWMCGFVSAYVKVGKFQNVFEGTKFMHICHNLDPLYEGRLYPKFEEGNLSWLVQLPPEWYVEYRNNKLVINPSKCALETCDNWGTVSNSYKYDLLKESPLAPILWKHPNPFAFPNGVRKDERVSIIKTKTPGTHIQSKRILQEKYFGFEDLNNNIPMFSFIGRITKQKGVHLIVDSVEALLHEFNFKIQFLVGGVADSKQDYGKYCAERMKYLNHRYPHCFWSNPDQFFTDGAIANIGSDYAMMPSLFEPGGIVQHEFFCGGTPVVAFRTGGLKDTVFEYNFETQKGNGFNFMSYDLEDFKQCMRRAINCYKDKKAYDKLRENAFDSVVEEEDVAKGWNTQFYRLQDKIYIDWIRVEKEIQSLRENQQSSESEENTKIGEKGQFWSQLWDIQKDFRKVLVNAHRIQGKLMTFLYESDKIPRPKQVAIVGSWDSWTEHKKMKYDSYRKLWTIGFKLKPGTYNFKYYVDSEWMLTKHAEVETDMGNNENHVIVVE